ncbi:hypothetical protein JXI42_14765 [bacterium]|nr:hypothetical protein [bacterium]
MRIKLLAIVLCFMLSGCYIQSLSKFYTEDLVVELPQIIGEWESVIQIGDSVSEKNISPWVFMEDKVASYDENNLYSELDVAYFKIGDVYLIDFTAGSASKDDEELGNPFWGVGITLTHSLCKIDLDRDYLVITPLNFEWFEDKIKDSTLILDYVIPDEESNYIFTASSSDWVEFLKKHIEDEGLFAEKYKFVFKRKS